MLALWKILKVLGGIFGAPLQYSPANQALGAWAPASKGPTLFSVAIRRRWVLI